MSPRERRPSWLAAALIGAGAFLAGVLLVAALGGAKGTTSTTTQRVTVTAQRPAPAPAGDRVPDVQGQVLDAARTQLEGAGLQVDVQGGGTFGVVDESNWEVVRQSPPGGARATPGQAVTVDVCRRGGC